MNKPDWKPFILPQNALYREINIQGRKVKVSVSPYDIPEAYRTWVEQERLLVCIEFKYIEDEKEVVICPLSNDIVGYVGKISNRLYKLECKIDPQILVSPNSAELLHKRTLEIVDVLRMVTSGKIKQTNSELVQSGIASHELAS